jgi:hypothetical protein
MLQAKVTDRRYRFRKVYIWEWFSAIRLDFSNCLKFGFWHLELFNVVDYPAVKKTGGAIG